MSANEHNKAYFTALFDQLLSQDLSYSAPAATEKNIKASMKKILGLSIRKGLLKLYSNLVLHESLDVSFTILTADNNKYDITLYYGK